MNEKILVVDDGKNICEILEFNLTNEGYLVDIANSAEEALQKLTSDHDLILLDVMMEGMSGFKMAQQLRQEKNLIPIIFLTAKDQENDMLTGFSVGADDYIAKPFSIKEVLARVKALLKRSEVIRPKQEEKVETASFDFGKIVIDPDAKELIIDGEQIPLTRTEYEILTLLASNPTKVFERETIIDSVWKDTPFITERTVDVHIRRLRKKIGAGVNLIISRPGYGYRFNPDLEC